MIQIDQIVYLHKHTTDNYKGLKFLHQPYRVPATWNSSLIRNAPIGWLDISYASKLSPNIMLDVNIYCRNKHDFKFDVFLTVHHSIDFFHVTNLMHTSFIL